MKKIIFVLMITTVFSFHTNVMASVEVSAKSAVVIENSSGKIIYEKNPHVKMPMASTTKIMTALCAIENLHPAHPVVVDKRSVGIEGSSIYLKEGEMFTVLELLYGMLLNSGNDAATALALAVSDSVEEFARLMTRTAKKIGAVNTNFTNPSGLYEENHYTTAYDLALITSYALQNKLFSEIVSSKTAVISDSSGNNVRYLSNHNKLLSSYDGCIGVKTGYTKKCGRCLVSAAVRDSVSLTCVTLNAPNDWNDHRSMLDYAFSRTSSIQIASQGDYAKNFSIDGVNCRADYGNSIFITSVDKQTDTAKIIFEPKPNLALPLNEGELIGTAYVVCNEKTVDKCDLISNKAVIKPEKRKKTFADSFQTYLRKFLEKCQIIDTK